MGGYISSGRIIRHEIRISVNDPIFLSKLRNWCKSNGIYYCVDYLSLSCDNNRHRRLQELEKGDYSREFVIKDKQITKLFRFWIGSSTKTIPTATFTNNVEFAKGLLCGYYCNEGYISDGAIFLPAVCCRSNCTKRLRCVRCERGLRPTAFHRSISAL